MADPWELSTAKAGHLFGVSLPVSAFRGETQRIMEPSEQSQMRLNHIDVFYAQRARSDRRPTANAARQVATTPGHPKACHA